MNEFDLHTILPVKQCNSLLSKVLGLMFTKKQKNCLIFEFKRPIRMSFHMFFVFYSIDILFLDSSRRLIEFKESFRPFTMFKSVNKSTYVVEIPVNEIKKNKLKLGDVLNW